ncbi:MAG TPA: hypothetical protein VGB25_07290, partial [Candidatus Binatia bacterium]
DVPRVPGASKKGRTGYQDMHKAAGASALAMDGAKKLETNRQSKSRSRFSGIRLVGGIELTRIGKHGWRNRANLAAQARFL